MMRLALLSDIRAARHRPEDQPLYRARLDRLIGSVNAAKVDMVLIAGNLTQNGRPEEIAEFKVRRERFTAPVRYVFGDQDVGGKRVPGRAEGITAARLTRIEMSLGPSFWAEAVAGGRIIAVNSSLFGSGLAREREQWAFLEGLLARPSSAPTLLLMHHPPFVTAAAEPGGDAENIEPKPRARLLKLLERGRVKAILCGRLRRSPGNRGAGLLVITTPPILSSLPPARQPQGWTQVTVSASGEVRFSFSLMLG